MTPAIPAIERQHEVLDGVLGDLFTLPTCSGVRKAKMNGSSARSNTVEVRLANVVHSLGEVPSSKPDTLQQLGESGLVPQRIEQRVVARVNQTGIADAARPFEPVEGPDAFAPLRVHLPLLVEHPVGQLRDKPVASLAGRALVAETAFDDGEAREAKVVDRLGQDGIPSLSQAGPSCPSRFQASSSRPSISSASPIAAWALDIFGFMVSACRSAGRDSAYRRAAYSIDAAAR